MCIRDSGNGDSAEDFGANAWLVDEMYKQYLADKNSVDQAWWPTLEKYAATSEAKATQPAAASMPCLLYTSRCV